MYVLTTRVNSHRSDPPFGELALTYASLRHKVAREKMQDWPGTQKGGYGRLWFRRIPSNSLFMPMLSCKNRESWRLWKKRDIFGMTEL